MIETGLRTETPLELHRKEFSRLEGRGPMLRVDDLSPQELEFVNADFLSRCRGRVDDITAIYEAYVQTLHSWGIICPHPQPHRVYMGFQPSDTPIQFEDAKWYDCKLCNTSVINR